VYNCTNSISTTVERLCIRLTGSSINPVMLGLCITYRDIKSTVVDGLCTTYLNSINIAVEGLCITYTYIQNKYSRVKGLCTVNPALLASSFVWNIQLYFLHI
jgi:hypothetical protein